MPPVYEPGASPARPHAAATVARLHREWIHRWDRREGDPEFDFTTVFADFYDFEADDVILFDDADPERRVFRDAAAFGRAFAPMFAALRRAEHAVEEGPEVLVSDRLAASRMVFVARLTAADGAVSALRALNSQVWRRGDDGRWRIVRDQTAVHPVDLHEAAALAAQAGG
ncbi:ketosteroid isomerase-like protein [Streptomonospora nanhaiensis]|uniref:Ketosteroid isomerase-like protein n=1 Tax=Streptomonospora nanhaiensis TaxID=1323731 RepID=A0A853BUD3_9ACTN|nr:DUF4440 domain-containing protein [Streptomonospora nanhaiensis]NYI98584.1 ketosteroid isomerase-like protein [Streptomonospora nanhaiensis]